MGFCTVSVGTSFSADFAGMVLVDSDSLAVLRMTVPPYRWTFSIASFCSQITFFSCEGYGGSCIYCRFLISGYDIH